VEPSQVAQGGHRVRSDSLERLAKTVERIECQPRFSGIQGRVVGISGGGFQIRGLNPWLTLGSLVRLEDGRQSALAEVICLEGHMAMATTIEGQVSLGIGASALLVGEFSFRPDQSWQGRIVDCLARPVDRGPPLRQGTVSVSLRGRSPDPLARTIVSRPAFTGVRVIDVFTPLCFGQRIGIFAGSGVGKSTLLSMLARAPNFDSIVIGLVGERGREVREFVEITLGDLARRAVTVVSTGDESASMRRMAPLVATSVAEYFRDRGQNVLLIMDSVTRYAHACREVALAAGEPPVARGFPPSVFGDLPRLLERAGPGAETGQGTITGIFSVLVDGDDHNDPIADAIRGTLDGHIVLSRAIAESGRFPAVDVLASVSRLAQRAWSSDQQAAVHEMKRLVRRFEETRDLRAVGGYQAGADAELDRAIAFVPKLYRALAQGPEAELSADSFREVAAYLL